MCDAYITHAATEKLHLHYTCSYRADHRETIPLICNAQYTIKILVLIEKKMQKIWFRYVLDNLELKIFFVDQPWWPTCFMLHLPRNLGPHLIQDLLWLTILYLIYLLLLVIDARIYKPVEILTNYFSYNFIKLANVFCFNVILYERAVKNFNNTKIALRNVIK